MPHVAQQVYRLIGAIFSNTNVFVQLLCGLADGMTLMKTVNIDDCSAIDRRKISYTVKFTIHLDAASVDWRPKQLLQMSTP